MVSDSSTCCLLIFIRNPQLGKVKTRLASAVGDKKALDIYKKLLGYTRNTVRPLSIDKRVWYSNFINNRDEWDPRQFTKKKQRGENLGQRMQQAFRDAFVDGYQRVVIIGSDCGQLTYAHLQQAYDTLKSNDVVIGPSEDGGYYLLGMSRYLPVLLDDKSWGTETVFEQTISDCNAYNLDWHAMEQLNDVDTKADWDQVKDCF